MINNELNWLPLDEGAVHFGYKHPESFRRRLRQLRNLGHIVDIGKPPHHYPTMDQVSTDKILLMWPNPKTALIRSDASANLLNPKRGKRKNIRSPE